MRYQGVASEDSCLTMWEGSTDAFSLERCRRLTGNYFCRSCLTRPTGSGSRIHSCARCGEQEDLPLRQQESPRQEATGESMQDRQKAHAHPETFSNTVSFTAA